MRYFFYFCLMVLPLSSCASVDVRRYLDTQYCPDALIAHGHESVTGIISAELYRAQSHCEVLGEGDVVERSFVAEGVDFRLILSGRLESPKSAKLNLFGMVVRLKDNQVVQRKVWTVNAYADTDFTDSVLFRLDAKTAKGHVVVGGFVR